MGRPRIAGIVDWDREPVKAVKRLFSLDGWIQPVHPIAQQSLAGQWGAGERSPACYPQGGGRESISYPPKPSIESRPSMSIR